MLGTNYNTNGLIREYLKEGIRCAGRSQVGQAASVAVWGMIGSYSTGGQLPSVDCRRRRLQVLSIQATIAIRSRSRVAHRCRSQDVHLQQRENDAMAALSAADATWLVEPTMP